MRELPRRLAVRWNRVLAITTAAGLGFGSIGFATVVRGADSPPPAATTTSIIRATVPGGPDLTGTWMLDREHSDKPAAPGGGMGRGGFGGGGMGRGGMGHGGFRRGGEGGERPNRDSGRRPNGGMPEKLILYQHDDTLEVDDGSGAKQSIAWGAATASTDSTSRRRTAHWDGSRLIVEAHLPRGGTRLEVFELVAGGSALARLLETQVAGRDEPFVIRSRYVRYSGE